MSRNRAHHYHFIAIDPKGVRHDMGMKRADDPRDTGIYQDLIKQKDAGLWKDIGYVKHQRKWAKVMKVRLRTMADILSEIESVNDVDQKKIDDVISELNKTSYK